MNRDITLDSQILASILEEKIWYRSTPKYAGGCVMIESVPSGTLLHGRYRIERVLGSGGFGHVYLAVNIVSNLQCAVKEYLVTGSTGQQQLEHEANVLSKLHHPNLPAFQDGFMERGRYYIVLSYIDGNDLTDRIRVVRQKNEIIPITQILQWLLAICDAVTFLHSQQPTIIHRDIKPDNIRITQQGTAVLVDLGNAKAPAKEGDRTLFFIRHQGTPGYAPPEQYPGGSGTDARSDVYALGATLFFALTTHEPPSVQVRNQSIQQGLATLPSLQEHVQNNPPEESPAALAARPQFKLGVNKPLRPAPRHSRHIAQLGKLSPELLSRLNAIVQKSMELNPKRRYQFVKDFVNDLQEVAQALGTTSSPPPTRPVVDPNSTQPDLVGIFDALQEAKRDMNRDAGDASPGTSSGNITCPRCGTSLVPRAAFCPRCGMAQARQTPPSSSNQQAQMQNRSPGKNQLAFPTEMKEAIAINTAGGVTVGNATPAIPTSYSTHSQQVQLQQWKSAPANGVEPHIVGPRGQNQNPRSSFISLLFKYRLLILCVVLLVIILVVILAYSR
jgi:serine/threonine protein kinase